MTLMPCCRVLTKRKGEARSGPNSGAEEGEVSDSESDIGEFDDGLDDELMGDEERVIQWVFLFEAHGTQCEGMGDVLPRPPESTRRPYQCGGCQKGSCKIGFHGM